MGHKKPKSTVAETHEPTESNSGPQTHEPISEGVVFVLMENKIYTNLLFIVCLI